MALAEMPEESFPVPIGVFHRRQRPSFESAIHQQLDSALADKGREGLDDLLRRGDTWVVE